MKIKEIRGQVRQIVKEELPGVLETEILQNIEKRLIQLITRRLDLIDERMKQLQSYMVRQTPIVPEKSAESKNE